MARPLPVSGRFPAIATDWSTQAVEADVISRRGRWWDRYIFEHHSDGRDRAFDRVKTRRNRALKAFLSAQTADPGL